MYGNPTLRHLKRNVEYAAQDLKNGVKVGMQKNLNPKDVELMVKFGRLKRMKGKLSESEVKNPEFWNNKFKEGKGATNLIGNTYM